MTPDWLGSSGARKEHAAAEREGQPIFYDTEALRNWLESV